MKNLKEITFETNGTQKLGTELVDYLYDWAEGDPFSTRSYESITFSVSAKLPASGEKWEEAIVPENILQYQESGHVYLKFVVATEKDIEDSRFIFQLFLPHLDMAKIKKHAQEMGVQEKLSLIGF